jgi:hypothetical protein
MAKSHWVPTDRYVPQPDRAAVVASCLTLLQAMVAAEGVIPAQCHYWLSRVMWSLTECEGKYNVRWASAGALRCVDTRDVRHEHVFPRGWLVHKVIEDPELLQRLDSFALACIVTRQEAERLNRQPPALGWGRYLNEGITVHDMRTFDEVSVADLAKQGPALERTG